MENVVIFSGKNSLLHSGLQMGFIFKQQVGYDDENTIPKKKMLQPSLKG